MAELTVPQVDFSSLGQLPQIYRQNQADALRRDTLANLGQGGSVDANTLLRSGDLSLAQLGIGLQNRTADQERQARQDAFQRQESQRAQRNADRSYGLQERAATRADDPTPTGFVKQADGSYAPISGGPQDPNYQARVAAETARARADVPTIIGAGGSVIVPNKASEGAIFTNKPAGGEALLDEDTIKAMAEQYRAGDTSVLQNLGRGAQGAENIVKLRKEVVRQNTEGGVSGAEQALRNAEMMGVKAGQRAIGTKGANIEMAATEFNQVIPIVQAASQAVSRTSYPDLNKIIMAYNEKTGDPNVVKFGGGVNTLVNLYARAISPSGVATVSDKDHAREILNKAWATGQFDAATGMMQQEIEAALRSPEKVRDEMRKRFLSGQGAAPVGYPAPGHKTAPVVIDGYTIKEN